ncbi:MAG: transporter substrate-binding domain-containing protein [Desulfuromonadaceae bacterium]|nr:transporter substrate-binding domain-containing protein [Desulfuromonadaceae bacterium]
MCTPGFMRLLLCLLPLLLLASPPCFAAAGHAAGTVELTDAEHKWLEAHPVITLAPDPDFKPIEYFDRHGNYQGAAADIIRILEKKLGVTITIVRPKNWNDAMARFKRHEVDLMGVMVRTPDREEFALFTDALVTVPGGIFTRRGSPANLTLKDLKGKKVAVVSNYAAHDILKRRYPEINLEVVQDVSTGLAKASLGMVDAYVENMANALFYSQEAGITNLQLAGKTDFDYRWGIGIRKDWPELQVILNKGLADISEEERNEAIHRWIYMEGQRWYPTKTFIVGAVASALGLTLLIVAGWSYTLRKEVCNRTQSLQLELGERQKVEQKLKHLSEQLEDLVRERTEDLKKEINERIKSEERLKVSEEIYRCFAELTSDYIHKCSRSGDEPFRVQWIGGAIGSISGYSIEEIYELGCWLPLVHPDDRETVSAYLINLAPGDVKQIEFRLVTKQQDIRWISEKSLCEAGPGEGDLVLLGAATDITELKGAEEERLKLEQQILHAQKLESLGVLAGGIAHDFNNILMAIIGNADLALMRLNRESPAADNLRRIEQAAARAADLARQMLAYSGKGKFVLENIDLNRLLEEMLHMLEVSISKKAVLRLNKYQPLPPVEADATQIRQIVMNLVINASEAIGDKSGVIAITTGCMECDRGYLNDVWLDENLNNGLYVYLEIADSGCGMDRGTMAKLFDPFFTTKFTGRGLGMAAVLGIVRGHRGAIKLYSEPGKGTTFKILLPASGRPAEIFNGNLLTNEWHGSGTVLLVDDEETVRGIGTEMLKELGFTTVTANDGQEAVELFKSTPEIVFVVLDLTMPHMDGEQCFRELRRLKPDVKVIISSGFNEQEVTQKFVGKGLAGFIQKPYRLSTLQEVIRNIAV